MNQVLLVNDNEEVMNRTANMLVELGWEVYTAESDEVTFASLVASRPTILIVDLEMEGGVGFQSIATGRRLYDDLFIIAVTRGGDKELWHQVAINNGADSYLPGPVSMAGISLEIDVGFKSGKIDIEPYPSRHCQH